jgi:hypothetical protein
MENHLSMQKFKLIKEYEDYYLISDKEIESGDEYVKLDNRPRTVLLGTTAPSTKVPKLSKQNCDEIFGVVDVDKLAEECSSEFTDVFDYRDGHGKICRYNNSDIIEKVCIKVFNKAMELNKDKVFSFEDMKQALFDLSDVMFNNCQKGISEQDCLKYRNIVLESLQQPTEIEVEIINECPQCQEWGYVSECRNDCNQKFLQPKLDVKGQLILKKV